MTCINDFESIDFKCGYKPCEHEGKMTFHKHDMDKYAVKQCPVCRVWNYKLFKDPKLEKVLDKIAREQKSL